MATRSADLQQERMTGLLGAAAGELARFEPGIRWVNRWLEAAAQRWELDDLVLVLEDRVLGRQVFRAGRRRYNGGWATRVAHQRPPGLYARPSLQLDQDEVDTVLRLCTMALELDVTRDLSLHDPLTGLHNRRGFEDAVAQAIGQSRRYGWPFTLVLIDLDDFKALNDRAGHAAGDAVLRAVGEEIRQALRRGDVAARLGGDEFAMVLSGTDAAAVPVLLDRLRQQLATEAPHGPVRFSAGAASCPVETLDLDALYDLADARLYREKGT